MLADPERGLVYIATLADHVPDRYWHNVRYFGLLAPRVKCETRDAVFALLGQERLGKPRRLWWAASLQKSFGVDPLLDRNGQRMRTSVSRPRKLDAYSINVSHNPPGEGLGPYARQRFHLDRELDGKEQRQERGTFSPLPSNRRQVTRRWVRRGAGG